MMRAVPARRAVAAVAFAALAAPTSGCGDSHSVARTPASVPARAITCTGLTDDCYFPFPTNLFTKPAATATGLSLDLHAESFRTPATAEMMRRYPPELLAGADGWSALAPVMMPLPALPDPASLPTDPAQSIQPDASVRLWDVDAGQPLAFRALLDGRAAGEAIPRALLSLVPQTPFASHHTIVALVTDRVRTADGAPMPAFEGFRRVLAPATGGDSDAERVRDAFQPVLATLVSALREDPAHAVLATAFTVRSNELVTRDLRALARAIFERARTNPPRFRVGQIVQPLPALETKGVAAGVIGYLTAPDYRDADHRIAWDSRGRPIEQREHELEFLLKLPKAGAGRAPVVVFGHGLGAFKETMLQITSAVGQRGYATIGIDIPGHHSRLGEDGPMPEYLTFERLLEGRDLLLQTVADELQLVRLVEGALTTLDVLPAGGDGVPDLAPAPVAFVGQSLGSTLGGALLAVEPAIGAAVLNVPGAGFISLFQQSPGLGSILDGMLPAGATAADRLVLVPILQLFFDTIDPGSFSPHVIDDPFPGQRPKDVLLQQAMDDVDVPASATALYAGALGVPQVEPSLDSVFGLETVVAPVTGSGLYQFHVSNVTALNHQLLLSRPGALNQVADFIDTRAKTGSARIDAE
ncbi:MAG: hypothetical protein U0610_17145 [bacterium]